MQYYSIYQQQFFFEVMRYITENVMMLHLLSLETPYTRHEA